MAGYWDRDDDRYNRSSYRGGERYGDNRDEDRGFFERAGDEVRSWFGDDEAERRRRVDETRDDRRERFDYDRGSDYRHNYGRYNYDSENVRRDLDRDNTWRGSGFGSYENYGRGASDNYDRGSTGNYRMSDTYGTNRNYGSQGYGSSSNYGYNDDIDRDWNRSHGLEVNRSYDRSNYGSRDYDRNWGNRDNDRNWNEWNNRGGRDNYRGPIERGTDEVRSWFGDDEAERRRRMDDRNDPRRDRW